MPYFGVAMPCSWGFLTLSQVKNKFEQNPVRKGKNIKECKANALLCCSFLFSLYLLHCQGKWPHSFKACFCKNSSCCFLFALFLYLNNILNTRNFELWFGDKSFQSPLFRIISCSHLWNQVEKATWLFVSLRHVTKQFFLIDACYKENRFTTNICWYLSSIAWIIAN